jgi:SGNH domain (fused to AT3 domains)
LEAPENQKQCTGFTSKGEIRTCNLEGDPKLPNTLIYGDSHAQMWLPRLSQAQSLGYGHISLAAMHGCPSLPYAKNHLKRCVEFNDKAVALAMKPSVDNVIIISSWYYSEADYSLCLEGVIKCFNTVEEATITKAYRELTKRLKLLTDKGKRVYIVLPSLQMSRSVPQEMARLRFLNKDTLVLTNIPRQKIDNQRAFIVDKLKKLASQSGATLIDPLDLFCDPMACSVVDEQGELKLRDTNHVREATIRHSNLLDGVLKSQ